MKIQITTKTVPVTLEINGKPEEYELREMDAATRDKYMDALAGRMRLGPDNKPTGVLRFEGMQADLLAVTLRKKDGQLVRKDVIQSWPASVVDTLFQESQKLNLLNRGAVDAAVQEAKNA